MLICFNLNFENTVFQQEYVLQQCFVVKPKKRYMMFLSKSTWEGKGQAGVEEQLLWDFLAKSDVFELMELDGIHLVVMTKSASVIVKLLSVICETT